MKKILAVFICMMSFSAFAEYSAEERAKLNAISSSLTNRRTEYASAMASARLYSETTDIFDLNKYCKVLQGEFGVPFQEFSTYAKQANSVLVSNDSTEVKNLLNSMLINGESAIANCGKKKASFSTLEAFYGAMAPLQDLILKAVNQSGAGEVAVEDYDRVTPGLSKLAFSKDVKALKGKFIILISKENGKKCELSINTKAAPFIVIPAGSEMVIQNRFDGVPNYGLYLMSERAPGDFLFALGCGKGLSVDQIQNMLAEIGVSFKDIK
nr:hypothetical protein BHI3_06280 [Bacteriovorax sp. HI3]